MKLIAKLESVLKSVLEPQSKPSGPLDFKVVEKHLLDLVDSERRTFVDHHIVFVPNKFIIEISADDYREKITHLHIVTRQLKSKVASFIQTRRYKTIDDADIAVEFVSAPTQLQGQFVIAAYMDSGTHSPQATLFKAQPLQHSTSSPTELKPTPHKLRSAEALLNARSALDNSKAGNQVEALSYAERALALEPDSETLQLLVLAAAMTLGAINKAVTTAAAIKEPLSSLGRSLTALATFENHPPTSLAQARERLGPVSLDEPASLITHAVVCQRFGDYQETSNLLEYAYDHGLRLGILDSLRREAAKNLGLAEPDALTRRTVRAQFRIPSHRAPTLLTFIPRVRVGIGTSKLCEIQLHAEDLSPIHCYLWLDGDTAYVAPLASGIPVWLDKRLVLSQEQLPDQGLLGLGEHISLGFTVFREAQRIRHVLLKHQTEYYCVGPGPLVLGRFIYQGSKSDIALDDNSISARHCQVSYTPEGFLVTDLQSSNGTFVNERQTSSALLEEDATITIGETKLIRQR